MLGTITRWDRRLTNDDVAVVHPDMHSPPFRTFLFVCVAVGGGGGVRVLADTDDWEPNLLLHALRLTVRGVT